MSSAPERLAIVVLGMHRSGTSAFTRVLSLLGCDLPKNLMGAYESNSTGHWESTAICNLNDAILKAAGSRWDDWQELDPEWLRSPSADEFREAALATLKDEFGASPLFVLKDPRICRMLGFWVAVFDAAAIRPIFVLSLRNPLEVASSLERRNGFDLGFSHLLWLRHVLDAEAASRGMTRFQTSYDRLLENWRDVAERSQSALAMAWPRPSDQAASEIDAFLSDKQRHHREALDKVTGDPALSIWLRESFAILARWAGAGENPDDYAALDRIRRDFNAAAPAFAGAIDAGRRTAEPTRALERSLAEARAKLSEAGKVIAEGRGQLQATAGAARNGGRAGRSITC
ncbi:MAG: sulfotransferase family protein [Propylenella sp.]